MRWLAALVFLLDVIISTARAQPLPQPAPLPQPDIWFNPHTPVDMGDMWTDDAPWQSAASKVKVLVLVDWWVRDPANRDQLIQMLAFAQRHHMQLDLDIEPILHLPTDN